MFLGRRVCVRALMTTGTMVGLIAGMLPAAVAETSSRCDTYDTADLGTLPGGNSSGATEIDDQGIVVGFSYTATGPRSHAVRWDRRNRIADLGTLPGDIGSEAFGVSRGLVVGYSVSDSAGALNEVTHAVRWDRSGQIIELETPPGYHSSMATAINATGMAVGLARVGESPVRNRAVRWNRDGQVTVLNDLPGGLGSSTSAINNAGVSVGVASTSTNQIHAVRWDRSGRITDLGTLPDTPESGAGDINNAGVIVGGVRVTPGRSPSAGIRGDVSAR